MEWHFRTSVGKLIGAARHWAGGGTPDLSNAAADAEAWGIPADAIETLLIKPPDYEVWPENVPIVQAFLAITTQWRINTFSTGKAYWQGLDYAAAKAGLELANIKLSPREWAGVQSMERAACAVLNGYRG